MNTDVIIIGAGAAGLAAARTLAEKSLRVIILEARDRVGGRVLSRQTSDGTAIELGAEFIHGRADDTMVVLREAGIKTIEPADEAWKCTNGAPQLDEEDFLNAAKIFEATQSLTEDESVARFLQRYLDDPSMHEDAALARLFVEGFDAADPQIASAKGIGDEWRSGADFTSTRPDGGYAPMFAYLLKRCTDAGVDLRLSTTARIVKWHRGNVAVDVSNDRGESDTLNAAAAVVTVPVGVLRNHQITFEPPLPPAKQDALQKIEMGHAVRVVLAFRTAFWQEIRGGRYRGAAFFRCQHEPFQAFWTQLPVRDTTIVAWAGGPKAIAMNALSRDERVESALQSVGQLLNDPVVTRREFAISWTHDWSGDAHSRGAYSYVSVGGENARAALADPLDQTIFIAGEATATDGQGGTVSGALKTGARAAKEVAAALA